MIRIFSTESDFERAQKAAHSLNVSVELCIERPSVHSGFYLWSHSGRLELGYEREVPSAYADMEALRARIRSGNKLHLSRSIGINKRAGLKVLDAMAGFGVDAMVMMGLGCEVQLYERSPIMCALLRDALDRFSSRHSLSDTSIVCGDVGVFLDALSGPPQFDVIYLDPMFPQRKKNALPNRRAQLLSRLVPEIETEQSVIRLIEVSRLHAGMRVVLKRRRTDPVALKPDWQVFARTVRYDVYRGVGEAEKLVGRMD